MRKILKDMLTGSDNETFELVNGAYFITFIFYGICTVYDLMLQPSASFNYQGFGTGLSLINASFGLHTLMKRSGITEAMKNDQ